MAFLQCLSGYWLKASALNEYHQNYCQPEFKRLEVTGLWGEPCKDTLSYGVNGVARFRGRVHWEEWSAEYWV